MSTTVNATTNTVSSHTKQIGTLVQSVSSCQEKIATLEEGLERNLRHGFSFDLLLHGIHEDPNEPWGHGFIHVKNFLTTNNATDLLPHCEEFAHRLGPARPVPPDPSLQPRPRPLLFRLKSRSSRTEFLQRFNKKTRPQGSPYISSHLTKLQIAELRSRPAEQNTPKSTIGGPQRQPLRTPAHYSPYASAKPAH